MSAFAEWGRRWFFVAMSARWLAALRIACALTTLFMLWPPEGSNLLATPRGLDHIPRTLWSPVFLAWPLFHWLGGPTDALLNGLKWAATISGLFVGVGLFTTLASVVCGVTYLVYTGVGVSFGQIYSLGTPLYLTILVGPFIGWGATWSIDQLLRGRPTPEPEVRFGAPLRLIHALVGLLFFFAAITKVVNCGMLWVGGGILGRYIIHFNFLPHLDPSYVFWNGEPRLSWLAENVIKHPTLGKLVELMTLGFEGLFIVSFFWRRSIPFFVLSAIGFHIGIHLAIPPVLGVPWLPTYVACAASYFAVVPAASKDAQRHTAQAILIALVLGVESAVCVLGMGPQSAFAMTARRALWPFLPQVMFTWKLPADGLMRSQLQLTDAVGEPLQIVSQPMLLGTRVTSVELSSVSRAAELTSLAARYRCEHKLIDAAAITVTEQYWLFTDLLASYDANAPYMPTRRKLVRTLALPACP